MEPKKKELRLIFTGHKDKKGGIYSIGSVQIVEYSQRKRGNFSTWQFGHFFDKTDSYSEASKSANDRAMSIWKLMGENTTPINPNSLD